MQSLQTNTEIRPISVTSSSPANGVNPNPPAPYAISSHGPCFLYKGPNLPLSLRSALPSSCKTPPRDFPCCSSPKRRCFFLPCLPPSLFAVSNLTSLFYPFLAASCFKMENMDVDRELPVMQCSTRVMMCMFSRRGIPYVLRLL